MSCADRYSIMAFTSFTVQLCTPIKCASSAQQWVNVDDEEGLHKKIVMRLMLIPNS